MRKFTQPMNIIYEQHEYKRGPKLDSCETP